MDFSLPKEYDLNHTPFEEESPMRVSLNAGAWTRATLPLLILGVGCDPKEPEVCGITPGSLVITEMMIHPSTEVGTNGEWIEVYNAGSEAVGTECVRVYDGEIIVGSGKDLEDCNAEVIEPGSYAILAKDAAPYTGMGTARIA